MKTLGLLMLDTAFPRLPGDVGHVASWAMPVLTHVVVGASPERVVRQADPALLRPFVDAARELVERGVAAVTTSCGFLVRWQSELQAALPVPLWSSALLALPQLPQPGVITIDADSLDAACLLAAGASPATPVQGLAAGGSLQRSLLGNRPLLDGAAGQAEVLAAAQALLARHPEVQTLVLECTNLAPFAATLQRVTGRSVHHLMTLVHERWKLLA